MTKNANSANLGQETLPKYSDFRIWVQNIWMENREEYLSVGQTPYKMHEYWNKYKYWLKREYKHQRKRNV